MDLRRQLANNILVIGGTAMIPGFLHRLNAELMHLVNVSTYVNRLSIREFHFHSPPAQLNYTAWLGGRFVLFLLKYIFLFLFFIYLGSIFGALDTWDSQLITREKYLENEILPDWFTKKRAV